MPKSKNRKNGKNIRNFSKIKIYVLGNVIRKAHAKFQETSSIGNTEKSGATQASDEDHYPYDKNVDSKSQI